MLQWTWSINTSSLWTSGLDPAYDQRRLDVITACPPYTAVYNCQPSTIELFQSPLLVPGTMSRHVMIAPISAIFVAAWWPTSLIVHSLDFVVPMKWRSHYLLFHWLKAPECVQFNKLATIVLYRSVLDYGTVCHLRISSRVTDCRGSVLNSKEFYLDSHIAVY